MMRALGAIVAVVAAFGAGSAAADEWVDYFGSGESGLSPRGYRMAAEVAAYSGRHSVGCIKVVGHLDTLEAYEFSVELGRRRAQAVAAELALLGVDPAIIQIESPGAASLARPTADRVAEPLNRRVVVHPTDRPCAR